MDKEKIINKVQKLLARSKSSNEHEAALAASMAQELMFRHKIAAIELAEEAAEEAREHEFAPYQARVATWKISLLNAVALGSGCKMFTRTCPGLGKSMRLVGVESDIQTVKYLYDYLCREIERIAEHRWQAEKYSFESWQSRGNINGKTWKNNFRLGAIAVIRDRLQEMRDKNRQEMRAEHSQALMVIDQQEGQIRQILSRLNLRAAPRSQARYDQDAFAKGRQAGRDIALASGKGLKAGAKRLKA